MVFLVGNKQDLESEREVSRETAINFQRKHNIKYFCETSAKSGENIEILFLSAAKFLYNQVQHSDSTSERSQSEIGGSHYHASNMGGSVNGSCQNSPRGFGKGDIDENMNLRLEEFKPAVKDKSGCKC